MRNLVVLTFLIASLSSIVKGADPKEMQGGYLGDYRCGVEATIIGNRIKLEIFDKNGLVAEDTIPLFKFQELNFQTSFSFSREVFGRTGEETKVVSGNLVGGKLESLTIKTKLPGLFNNTTNSCKNLSPQGHF